MTSTLGWLRAHGRPARARLALTVALGEITGILLVAQTALFVEVGNGLIFRHATLRSLLPAFLGALGVIVLRAMAGHASKGAAAACASVVKKAVRAECVSRLPRIGPVGLARMPAGRVAHVAVDAVEGLDAYYSRYLPQRAIATLLPFTILAVIFPLDWISGLVLVLTAVFLPLSMIVIGEESHERNRRLWGRLAQMSGRFLDILQGLATVRMFDAAQRETREIERTSDEYRTLTMSVLRVAFLSSFMLELISAVSMAIVAVLSGLRLLSGHMDFRFGFFILLIAPEYFLTLRMLGTFYHSRMEAVSAAEQIEEFLATPTGEAPSSAVAAPAPAWSAPAIGFHDVSFSYGGKPVLQGASFQIPRGEHVALVGESGAGKSTILALLLGFAAAQAGSISIDERSLSDLDVTQWRHRIAWLPQGPTIFHGTLRDNILLGRSEASEEEVRDAVRLARVDEFLARLPSGVDTLLGDGGQSLSAGQAQRVALARLFLRRPVLVLLDEPTAHLDAESALLAREGINALTEGRTAIEVTHKLPALPSMDRVLVLRDGRVREGVREGVREQAEAP
jgi:ATP-binding cassette subfamily C protein CydD